MAFQPNDPRGRSAAGLFDEEETKEAEPILPTTTFITDDDWIDRLRVEVGQQLRIIGPQIGLQDYVLDANWRDDIDLFIDWIDPFVANETDWQRAIGNMGGTGGVLGMEGITDTLHESGFVQVDGKLNPHHQTGQQRIFDAAMFWASQKYGFDPALFAPKVPSGPRGPRKPTPQEIRNQFDVDQLTNAVTEMGRRYLVEEYPKARQVAQLYVDEVVRTGAEKTIDFETFVKARLRQTPRWQQIYRNKAAGVDELAYLDPYVRAASAAIGGGSGNTQQLSELAGGGAALGSSPDAFAARLQKTDQIQNSAGFISNLESRVSGLANFLRG
jgi:hypothetical protein